MFFFRKLNGFYSSKIYSWVVLTLFWFFRMLFKNFILIKFFLRRFFCSSMDLQDRNINRFLLFIHSDVSGEPPFSKRERERERERESHSPWVIDRLGSRNFVFLTWLLFVYQRIIMKYILKKIKMAEKIGVITPTHNRNHCSVYQYASSKVYIVLSHPLLSSCPFPPNIAPRFHKLKEIHYMQR